MLTKRGFTLVEILTAVVIIAILAVMAVPLYEKTIERSRLVEAQTVLNRLQAAKNQAMDNMGCLPTYGASQTNCPKLKHLNVTFQNECPSSSSDTSFCSKGFKYSIAPGGVTNGVCATRKGGEYDGTQFYYYYGEFGESGETPDFFCVGANCENYGVKVNSGTGLSCEN